jgi:site-specific DNA-methyltransferase (cytosine-N4-specific)
VSEAAVAPDDRRASLTPLASAPSRPRAALQFLTEPGDLVVDPFAGSNTTGMVAETLERRWLAMDAVEEYLEASKFRFNGSVQRVGKKGGVMNAKR